MFFVCVCLCNTNTGVCGNETHVFVIGGILDDSTMTTTAKFQIYSIKHDAWTKGPDMKTARESHMCEYSLDNDAIYVFGGDGTDNILDSIEKYSFDSKWKLLSKQHLSTAKNDCATVVYNNYILICGGSQDTGEYSSICDVFDLTTETMANFTLEYATNDAEFEMVIDGTTIYAIGGLIRK